jgi:P-type conjugative transfer protein TrbJ
MTKHLLKIAVVAAILTPLPAFAGGGLTGGATLPEQIVQEGTAVEQLAKQAEEVTTQIQQYENMIQNMETIPSQLMSQIESSLNQFVNISSQAQSLSENGANLAQQFEQMNSGSVSPQEMQQYEQDYQQIAQNLQNSIDNVLQQANLNPSNFQTVAQAQQAIESDLQNPQSRNNLLQAAAEAGQAETTQLGQLVQTVNAQANLQAEVQQKKLAAQTANQEANQEAINAFEGPSMPLSQGGSGAAFNRWLNSGD